MNQELPNLRDDTLIEVRPLVCTGAHQQPSIRASLYCQSARIEKSTSHCSLTEQNKYYVINLLNFHGCMCNQKV